MHMHLDQIPTFCYLLFTSLAYTLYNSRYYVLFLASNDKSMMVPLQETDIKCVLS